MQDQNSPKYKVYDHEWDTSARSGYEDRPTHQPRNVNVPKTQQGSPMLRTLGGFAIVLGMAWGAYAVTAGGDIDIVLRQNRGPMFICIVGVIASLLGKYIR